jgi:16S rRNA (cytosine967-C5)-methyltransferase
VDQDIAALIEGLPPTYEHSESLLLRAAGPGPMRALAERAWAAVRRDPGRAAFTLRHHLRRPAGLRSWERRLVAAGLYALVRGHRLLEAALGTGAPGVLWGGWLVHQGLDPASTGVDLAAAAPCADLAGAAARALAGLGPAERLEVGASVPPELARRLLEDLGAQAAPFLAASARRAPLVLRLNPARMDPAEALAALAADGLEPRRLPLGGPAGAAVAVKRCDIFEHRLYLSGAVEVQDAGSQALAALVAAAPGEVVLDCCAGGGGKALALAAAVGEGGRVYAHDVRPRRLAALLERAERAGVRRRLETGLPPRADAVLVDAPCSGSGTLRRDPCLRWRLGAARVAAQVALQGELLASAAARVAPGGRLIYGTCSVFRAENRGVVDAFLATRPGFSLEREWAVGPHTHDTDGFYGAVLRQG